MTTHDSLFPLPKLLHTSNSHSSSIIRFLLQQNFEQWNIFINDIQFHNHLPYSLLALWALGADEATLRAAYERGLKLTKPLKSSPGSITGENFLEHLGDPSYYAAYLQYYTLLDAGKNPEHYIFSPGFNFVKGLTAEEQPQMLSRLMDGLLHPLIHLGVGIQCSIPGLIVQGLALIAVSKPSSTKYIDNNIHSTRPRTTRDTHPLSVMARIANDKRLVIRRALGEFSMYEDCIDVNGDVILEYAQEWALGIDGHDVAVCRRKAEELIWFNTVAYGGVYNTADGTFLPDFFLMHLLTSASYFHSIHSSLTAASSRIALLKTYFCVSLTWWIAAGRPQLDIKAFYHQSQYAIRELSWESIMTIAVNETDEHFPKVIRILRSFEDTICHFCRNTDLEGAELLDRSFFWRLAAKTTEVVLRRQQLWNRARFLKRLTAPHHASTAH